MIIVDFGSPAFLSGHRWSTYVVNAIPIAKLSRIHDAIGTKDDLKEGDQCDSRIFRKGVYDVS